MRVKDVRFFTRSNKSHSRQIVVTMVDDEQHRFSEGEMRLELRKSPLLKSNLRAVSRIGCEKVKTFYPFGEELLIIDSSICTLSATISGEEYHPVTVAESCEAFLVQERRDLRVAQNLLYEFQHELEHIPHKHNRARK